MAIRFYDEAVVNKIKSWVKDPNLTITSPDETARLFEYSADINDDRPIQLPLIAIRRNPSVTLNNSLKTPLTFDAATLDASRNNVKSLSAIPIDIGYQLDIYTRYFAEADEYVRNFVFNIINYPTLEITIPYNDVEYKHKSTMRLNPELQDGSSIPERLIPGQFTRWIIQFNIDDAYLWSVPLRATWSVEAETQIDVKTSLQMNTDVNAKGSGEGLQVTFIEKDNT